jgi:hypothetical protein
MEARNRKLIYSQIYRIEYASNLRSLGKTVEQAKVSAEAASKVTTKALKRLQVALSIAESDQEPAPSLFSLAESLNRIERLFEFGS